MCQIGFVGDFDFNNKECKIVHNPVMSDESMTEKQCMAGAFLKLPEIAAQHPHHAIKKFFCLKNSSGVQHEKT